MDLVLDIGDELPQLDLDSQYGRILPRELIEGSWCLLVTLPSAFDPIATTDIGALGKLFEEFKARNIIVLAICKDTSSNIRQWIKDIEAIQSITLTIPILSDYDGKITKMLGCGRENINTKEIHPVSTGAFLIDLDKTFRFSLRSSVHIGRNWFELLRQFDALMLVSFHPVCCPSNWGQGQQVLVKPGIKNKDLRDYPFVEIRPWFKALPCPENL